MTKPLQLPALDPATLPVVEGSGYPPDLRDFVAGRKRRRLGDALGLTQFGVNIAELPPGCWSALRHWHASEDEFVYVLEGELVLVTNGGEQLLRPGMAAGFPAGKADGHHLINRTDKPVRFLEIGSRAAVERVTYPEADLRYECDATGKRYSRKDGTAV